MVTARDRFRGCLLGGAVGDALGAEIEFLSLDEIHRCFGPSGVTGYVNAYDRLGAITDDTQMTLFTAEGLLRARATPVIASHREKIVTAIWHAYQRWLITQTDRPRQILHQADKDPRTGWLITNSFLQNSRAPGTTCLRSLTIGRPGSVGCRINNSKGCGGVMRVAPVGLAAQDPFTLACAAAALTHGHPSGFLSAGAFAVMISQIAKGSTLREAVATAIRRLQAADDNFEVTQALTAAVQAACVEPASAETIAHLGQGWVAEEALAIATYCALTASDFRAGVLLAVNHGGDSDSTGAICGNLLGTALGAQAIDADLLTGLEGRVAIEQIADDLHDVFAEHQSPPAERYPPE